MAFFIMVIISLIFLHAGQNQVNLKPGFDYDQMPATFLTYFPDSCL
jgi:hypothetical protein